MIMYTRQIKRERERGRWVEEEEKAKGTEGKVIKLSTAGGVNV